MIEIRIKNSHAENCINSQKMGTGKVTRNKEIPIIIRHDTVIFA